MLRNGLVCGINNDRVQQKLSEEKGLTLKSAMTLAQQSVELAGVKGEWPPSTTTFIHPPPLPLSVEHDGESSHNDLWCSRQTTAWCCSTIIESRPKTFVFNISILLGNNSMPHTYDIVYSVLWESALKGIVTFFFNTSSKTEILSKLHRHLAGPKYTVGCHE